MKVLINGYTVTEHIEIKRSVYSNKEIISLDRAIGHLKRNKKEYMKVVVMVAYIFLISSELAFATDKIVAMGNQIVDKIQLYAGIVATVMAAIELSGELVKGGRNHFQIIFKYGVGYVALLLIPMIFETIRNLF